VLSIIKPKTLQNLKQYLLTALISVAIVTGMFLYSNGLPIFGIPDAKEIASVEIIDLRQGTEPKKFTEPEQLEMASKMPYFLSHRLLPTKDESSPLITITYQLKDGKTWMVQTNETAVFLKGKAYPIRKKEYGDTFAKIIEGYFFCY
jgi:hypothetical protein